MEVQAINKRKLIIINCVTSSPRGISACAIIRTILAAVICGPMAYTHALFEVIIDKFGKGRELFDLFSVVSCGILLEDNRFSGESVRVNLFDGPHHVISGLLLRLMTAVFGLFRIKLGNGSKGFEGFETAIKDVFGLCSS